MHDIEPYHHWRDRYVASEDKRSPFYGRQYSEFVFSQKIYNYYIHPQWDDFGSATLYMKLLYTDYEEGYAVMEFIGEWNDCLQNDIMHLKRNVVDPLLRQGIDKYVLICDNVLNFHGSDDCYYEEWFEEVSDSGGWISLLNTQRHVEAEMRDTQLQYFVNVGGEFNEFNWRVCKPRAIVETINTNYYRPMKALS